MHEYDCYVPFIFENQYREAVRRIKLPENSTISRDAPKKYSTRVIPRYK